MADSDSQPTGAPPAAEPAAPAPVPVVVHLSGSRRGTTQRLRGDDLWIGVAPDDAVRVAAEPQVAEHHVALHRRGGSYELVAAPGRPVWVNGEPATRRPLASGDVLEIGKDGPVLRFRLYPPGSRADKSVAEAFNDCYDTARYGTRTPVGRAALMVSGAVRELGTQTALWLRLLFVAVLVLLLTVGYLTVRSSRLERRLASEVEGIAQLVESGQREALKPEELAALRRELATTEERVGALEERAAAPQRVITAASRSVLFLQGAYGFVDPESGRPLRFAGLEANGLPVRNPDGSPAVGLGGTGPLIEARFTGTAFVVTAEGTLLTNRHVALPWVYDGAAQTVISQGFEPVMSRFIAWPPGEAEATEVRLLAASDDHDLAVLSAPALGDCCAPLPLALDPPLPGDGVIVLGYPAGIQALLARAEESVVRGLMATGTTDFWSVVEGLARHGQIAPLASGGIVAQVTPSAVVYDAETTRGGSGGPVLDLDGNVVAITSAVVTDFGGSNLAVPAAGARELLAGGAAAASPAADPPAAATGEPE